MDLQWWYLCGYNLVLNVMLVFEYHIWRKKIGFMYDNSWSMWYWYMIAKNKAWGDSVYEEGVKIKDLCQSMGYEVINTSLELTENEDHILA